MRLDVRLLFPCLSLLVAACSSNPQATATAVDQSGVLKVHPGLLGKPVPAELRSGDESKRPVRAETAPQAVPLGKSIEPAAASRNSVYFDVNEVRLKPAFLAQLEALVPVLTANPKARLRLEGHADERGPEVYNKRLSQQRATAVRQFLVSKGVSEKQLEVLPFGKAQPKIKGHDDASWAENRRVDLVFAPEK